MRARAALPCAAVLALLASAVLLVPVAAGEAVAAPGGDAASHVLIRWRTPSEDQRAAIRSSVGVHRLEGLAAPDLEVAAVGAGQRAASAVAALSARPDVVYAEVDRPIRLLDRPDAQSTGYRPDDRYFPEQWALDNTGQPVGSFEWGRAPGTPDVDLDAPEAWTASRGGGVVVAILDAGMDTSHPDLAPKLWRNPGERRGNGVDDDGNGLVDDVHGWDFVNGDGSLFDPGDDDHGTHVAGILGAATGNSRGIAGVAPHSRLMVLKVLGPAGGTVTDAIRAIEYAATHGARVVNASWGGSSASRALRETIARTGVAFVAAAGNGGEDAIGDDTDATPNYPAAFRLPNLVSVAAVDSDGRLAAFSNFGRTTVDVAAPGVQIASTAPGGAYAWSDGTSMAAPHVAGVAALLASHRPQATGADLVDTLRATVDRSSRLREVTVAGGMVNAAAALGIDQGRDGIRPPSDGSAGASASGAVGDAGGGSVTTDPEGRGVTRSQPVHVDVRGTVPSTLSVATATTSHELPGWDLSDWWVDLEVAEGDVEASRPLVVEFVVHPEVAPEPDRFAILHGAVPLGACTSLDATPDPCVADRAEGDDGAVVVTVRTSRGGVWRFGQATSACPAQSVPRRHYPDVLSGSFHRPAIDCAAWWAITEGVGSGRYGPDRVVTRGQMAAFLDRLLRAVASAPTDPSAEPGPGAMFRDTSGTPFGDSIARLAGVGIVQGYDDGTYRPAASVTRAQMASYLTRTWARIVGAPLARQPADRFQDDDASRHEAAIDLAAGLGFAEGVTETRFAPTAPVRRDQMASFLTRVLDRWVTEAAGTLPPR